MTVFCHSSKTVTNTASVQRTEVHINHNAAKPSPGWIRGSSGLRDLECSAGMVTPLGFLLQAWEEEVTAVQCRVIVLIDRLESVSLSLL